ncbi:type IV pilus modification protein PilV [Microbulbifer guangxiensis]|uniref:type IV pilus modification protein PilV n=1 Tax=Microbulbifer guangxiensis TaxID=2904249 RepID=UPI001F181B1C|nr:type IV pilus modification protein PilV [Microbulbifer guangxiensis]
MEATMHRQEGATLIEVLITVLVMSVGLLGLTATQVVSLKNANNASTSYFASLTAYDIAERMRINPLGVGAGAYDATGVDKDRTPKQTCTAGICSSLQLADMDLFEWGQMVSANLPGGEGAVAVDNNGVATITLTWSGQHTGEDLGTAAGGAEDQAFELVVEL